MRFISRSLPSAFCPKSFQGRPHPRILAIPFQQATFNMSTETQPNGSTQRPKIPNGKKEVKILMLHGYTQSGPLFRAKTRALEKMLIKALNPIALHPTLIYPTAPNRLSPRDIPGYLASSDPQADEPEEESDAWAWFRKDEGSGQYRFFDEGMARLADVVSEEGGVDGVLGFSQGGAVAGFVAAALEPDRAVPQGPQGEWARKLREANGGRGLKFAVSYSGFYAPVESLAWCYEPKIKTPLLNVLGSLDTVVEESRSRGLVDRCEDGPVVIHPGGHYVPVSKEWVMALAGFVKQHAEVKLQAGL